MYIFYAMYLKLLMFSFSDTIFSPINIKQQKAGNLITFIK